PERDVFFSEACAHLALLKEGIVSGFAGVSLVSHREAQLSKEAEGRNDRFPPNSSRSAASLKAAIHGFTAQPERPLR
ncbi:hypothetical protein NL444_26970, partial [Klebsiella pneumoniae]|nr:hypothetical protein [Klebsiella pneumoniae]